MRAVGRWYKEVQTLLLLVAVAITVGYWLGSAWAALTLVLAWRLLVYLWQLRRVLSWIDQPESEPPEGSGVWGMMLDQMYAIQRHNRDARSR
jgi:two-component system phosphate regulon sensor histidine kinase PhoR